MRNNKKYNTMEEMLVVVLLILTVVFIAVSSMKMCNNTDTELEEATIETTEEVVETTEEVVETTVDIYQVKSEEMQAEIDSLSTIEDKMEWFIAYKSVLEKYSEWVDLPLTIYDVYSAEEIRYMQKCAETETYQKPFEARVNVVNVVLNRVKSTRFPNDAVSVVTAANQFAYGRDVITEESILAVEYAFMFEDTTNGALFFNSFKEAPPVFCKASYMFTDVAGHHFYK